MRRGAVRRVSGWAGRKLLCEGGGGTRKPIFPTPPPPSLAAVTGGGVQGGGARPAVPGGGGVNPTSMAQNDTHAALIILTTQMWGGKLLVEKTFSGQNFVFLRLRRQHPFLHKTKGPTRNPFSPNPPPSFGGRPCPPPPPPPPAEQFSGRLGHAAAGAWACAGGRIAPAPAPTGMHRMAMGQTAVDPRPNRD